MEPAPLHLPGARLSRIHGRYGVAYIAIQNAVAASPMAFLSEWDVNFVLDQVDVTAMLDQRVP